MMREIVDVLRARERFTIYSHVDPDGDALVFAADDVTSPGNRAIAVAALGFSSRTDALDPILNAVRDEIRRALA